MCEFLIYAWEGVDDGEHYVQGDIISIKDNLHEWGKEEHPATSTRKRFFLIKATDITLSADIVSLLTSPYVQYAEDETITILKKRKWYVDVTQLTEEETEMYTSSGIIIMPWYRLSSIMINKETNSTFN